jgi:mRNA interferase MazF
MTVRRGDVVLAWYPFASGSGGKRRPCLVIQNDADNSKLTNTIVAQITSNLRAVSAPTQLLIEMSRPECQQSGLLHDSLVSCNNLATIEQSLIAKVIGSLPPALMTRIEGCLKLAMGLS